MALMISLLIAQVLASQALAVERSRAGVPDSSMCLVDPWDEWGKTGLLLPRGARSLSQATDSGRATKRLVLIR